MADAPVGSDLLQAGDVLLHLPAEVALHDVRPVEKVPGTTQAIYDRYFSEEPWSLDQMINEPPVDR